MFTSMHSAAVKLAAKLGPRPSPTSSDAALVELKNVVTTTTEPYRDDDPKPYKQSVKRLAPVGTQDHKVVSHIRGVGLRVLRKAKKLWTKSTPGPVTLAVSISSESFEALHISFYEETEGSFDWTPNSAYLQDAFPDSPCAACDLYNVDSEGEYEREYESPSVFSEDSGHLATSLSHQYQDLSDILEESHYEWETADDTEFRALLEVEDDSDHISSESGAENDGPSSVPEARDDNDTWTWSASGSHRDDETSSFLAIPNQGNNWTAASPISTYFCPPTPASTLAPLTPSGSGFRPSTPVLVHESASYEEALFAEFKEMIARKGVKGNGA